MRQGNQKDQKARLQIILKVFPQPIAVVIRSIGNFVNC